MAAAGVEKKGATAARPHQPQHTAAAAAAALKAKPPAKPVDDDDNYDDLVEDDVCRAAPRVRMRCGLTPALRTTRQRSLRRLEQRSPSPPRQRRAPRAQRLTSRLSLAPKDCKPQSN
jgi:hypothetical protein